jgi:hypothetical protein
MKERHFDPLGMKATGWEPPARNLAIGHHRKDGKSLPAPGSWRLGAAEAAGGLYTTLEDLARFTAFQMNAWPPRDWTDDGPVKRSTVRESHMVGGFARATGQAFGMAWDVIEDPRVGQIVRHAGSTLDYSATVAMAPRRGVAVITLVGTDYGHELLDLTTKVLRRVYEADPQPDTLGAPVEAALARVHALIRTADVPSIEKTFTPGFLRGLPALPLVDAFTKFRADHGTCKTDEVRAAASPVAATVRLACERDKVDVQLHVDAAPPHLIHELQFDFAPKP